MPTDPAGTVRALRACRKAMIEVSCVKLMGPVYHAASKVISAIDAMATPLTGERFDFSAECSTASYAFRGEMKERMARERGEKLWRP